MRLAYLDAARGLALVLMVVNHTARYWLADDLGPWPLIYLTTAAAGPTFLFLVGFVLPLAYRASAQPARHGLRRAGGLFAAGYALNVVLWPEQPLLGSNVLHTIGIAVLAALVARRWLGHPWGRYAVVAAGVTLYGSFVLLFPPLSAWVAVHPVIGQLAFYDFPPWPWLGLVFLGLALGAAAADIHEPHERAAFHARLGLAAMVLALAALTSEWWWPVSPRLVFARDLLITNHWLPRGATVGWVLAWVLATIAACHGLIERRGMALRPLGLFGRAALFLYLAHHVIIVSLVQRLLGVSLRSWALYWLATALLLALLVPIAAGWTSLRERRRRVDTRARADLSAAA
jgi:uncharacterized membrane protein